LRERGDCERKRKEIASEVSVRKGRVLDQRRKRKKRGDYK